MSALSPLSATDHQLSPDLLSLSFAAMLHPQHSGVPHPCKMVSHRGMAGVKLRQRMYHCNDINKMIRKNELVAQPTAIKASNISTLNE